MRPVKFLDIVCVAAVLCSFGRLVHLNAGNHISAEHVGIDLNKCLVEFHREMVLCGFDSQLSPGLMIYTELFIESAACLKDISKVLAIGLVCWAYKFILHDT